jgi:hypothetical protein
MIPAPLPKTPSSCYSPPHNFPPLLVSPFLTVKEAAVRTGKSPSSIRRIIYPIIHDNAHHDRHLVQPGVEEATQLRLKGENFAWRLSEELLKREIPQGSEPAKGSNAPATAAGSDEGGALLAMLRRELDIKNQQITQQSELIGKQMELISGLSERLREGNVLLGTLQQRLTLPEAKPVDIDHTTAPARQTAPAQQKGSKSPPRPAPKPKRGFFARLFR